MRMGNLMADLSAIHSLALELVRCIRRHTGTYIRTICSVSESYKSLEPYFFSFFYAVFSSFDLQVGMDGSKDGMFSRPLQTIFLSVASALYSVVVLVGLMIKFLRRSAFLHAPESILGDLL